MKAVTRKFCGAVLAFSVVAAFAPANAQQPAMAEKKYGPGVTDTEIKLGQTMPYSGAASGLSLVGKVQSAYFKMINAQGGVNGRKINFVSLDDAFSPPKTVEQTRTLVEGEEVLAIFSSMGSAPNLALPHLELLLDKFPPMTGAASPNRVDVVDGGKDQHGRAARGGGGGDGALPVGQAGGKGTHPRRAVRDDGLASQACGTRPPATPRPLPHGPGLWKARAM
jgi:Periplasmic binding protein